MFTQEEFLNALSDLMYRQWLRLIPESDRTERAPSYANALIDHRMIARMRAQEVIRLLGEFGVDLHKGTEP